jgi:hypothetical protein
MLAPNAKCEVVSIALRNTKPDGFRSTALKTHL